MPRTPGSSAEVDIVAWPELSKAAVASGVLPSWKVTVPEDTGSPPLLTIAVKVTGDPTFTGLDSEYRVVTVLPTVTACVNPGELLAE